MQEIKKKLQKQHIHTFIKSLRAVTVILFFMTLSGCNAESAVPAGAPVTTAEITLGSEDAPVTPQQRPELNSELKLHFLDVGQGLSVLAVSNGQAMLYDGGDRDYSSFVVSYLKEQGIETLDYVIASHYDADHLNGIVGAMNAFPVNTIIGPDYIHPSKVYESFVRRAGELGKEVVHPRVGTEYILGSANITILSPQTIGSNSNNNSVAVKIEHGDTTILIMGDAEHAEEADIIASGIDLDSTILVLGHHGSASSTTWDLLEHTVPEYAVISCGKNNSYGHPHAETMEKLESMEIELFRTDQQGTVTVVSNGQSLTWNQQPSADYSSGNGNENGTETKATSEPPAAETAISPEALPVPETTKLPDATSAPQTTKVSQMVWQSATGSKYHAIPNCGNMNPDKAVEITLDHAESIGLGRCKNCWR